MSSPRPPYGSRPAGGTATAPLRLGHLVPERLPVVIERPNPEYTALAPDDPRRERVPEMVDVILQGYVFGSRCPGVVKAELASIEEQWQRALAASGDDSDSLRAATGFVTAWHTFLRESVLALVPGLTPGEADVLAAVPPGEEGPATALLRYLGLSRPGAEEEGEEASPQPVGDESTTASLSPTSSPSTTSDPPIC